MPNNKKAIYKFELLTVIDEKNADNHGCLGLLYETIGNKEGAAAEFRKSLLLNPNLGLFYGKIAIDYATKKDYEKSIFYMNLVIERDLDNPIHHKFLGSLYYNLDRYDEAINEMYKAIEYDKLNAEFYFDIGSMSLLEYIKTENVGLLEDAVYSLIIYDELKPNKSINKLAERAYEILNNIKIDDDPNSINNLMWQKYKSEIRIDFLKSIQK